MARKLGVDWSREIQRGNQIIDVPLNEECKQALRKRRSTGLDLILLEEF